MTRESEQIIIQLKQIYTLRGIKLELSVDKTKTPALVGLEREIIKMMNIIYQYKPDQVE